MTTLLVWLFVLLLLAAAVVVGLWGYRAYTTGDTSLTWGNWFGPPPEPRLSVSEQANVDGRRKLLLIRRDDVEHLIMTGGPVDVVIETNIAAPRMEAELEPEITVAEEPAERSPPVFSRQPRSFGQAVNE
jgi:flagellar protein FliO/FliZ